MVLSDHEFRLFKFNPHFDELILERGEERIAIRATFYAGEQKFGALEQ